MLRKPPMELEGLDSLRSPSNPPLIPRDERAGLIAATACEVIGALRRMSRRPRRRKQPYRGRKCRGKETVAFRPPFLR